MRVVRLQGRARARARGPRARGLGQPRHANGDRAGGHDRARAPDGCRARRRLHGEAAPPRPLPRRGGPRVRHPAPRRGRLHRSGPVGDVRRPAGDVEREARLGALDPGGVLRGLAVPSRRGAGGAAPDDHDGHPHLDRLALGLRLQRLGDPRGPARALLRHGRRHRHAHPPRQGAGGPGADDRRRRLASAARTGRQGGDAARGRRRAPRADRGRAPGLPGRRPPRGEDPGGRRGEAGDVLDRPLAPDRRVRPGRRRPRRRGRRRGDQRPRPARRLRLRRRRQHEARGDRPAARAGAGIQGPDAAAGRPHLLRLRPGRPRPSPR